MRWLLWRKLVVPLVGIVLGLAALSANADVIGTLQGVNPGLTGYLSGTALTGGAAHVWAGQLDWGNASGLKSPTQTTFWTYCVQINNDIGIGGTYRWTVTDIANTLDVDLNPTLKVQKATALQQLFGYVQTQAATGTPVNGGLSLGNAQAAALQLAVWEIVYSPTDPYTTSLTPASIYLSFTADSDNTTVQSVALSYLTNFKGYGSALPLDGLTSVGAGQNQAITASQGGPVVPAPATSVAVIAMLGVGGLFGRLRGRA